MKKLLFVAAAILAASLGTPAIAAESAKDPKANAAKELPQGDGQGEGRFQCGLG